MNSHPLLSSTYTYIHTYTHHRACTRPEQRWRARATNSRNNYFRINALVKCYQAHLIQQRASERACDLYLETILLYRPRELSRSRPAYIYIYIYTYSPLAHRFRITRSSRLQKHDASQPVHKKNSLAILNREIRI